MSIHRAPRSPGKLANWLGWAGLDAVGRLALLTGSTIVFSRLLPPGDFGIAALVLALVALGAVFVGAPFEEALVQKRGARTAHFSVALFVSILIGVLLVVMSVFAAPTLARFYNAPVVAVLLPAAMLSILFGGYADILNALARRLMRFDDCAFASLASHVVGVTLAIVLAFAGYGLWALVGQRIFVVIARAAILHMRLGAGIIPQWSAIHLRDIVGYARISFLSRLADALTYLAFNNVVQALFGVLVLGYVNMAMRLIEPLRGAVVATAHNLALSHLARLGASGEQLPTARQTVLSLSALVITPMFAGLAAVTPVLLPLMAGPGWEPAVTAGVLLAIGCALAVPAQLVFTAFSATGRPGLNLGALVASFAVTFAVLLAAVPFGSAGVGLARAAGDATRAGLALSLTDPLRLWTRRDRIIALLPAWLMSAVMAVAVAALATMMTEWLRPVALAGMIAAGSALYLALLRIFACDRLAALIALIRPARTAEH